MHFVRSLAALFVCVPAVVWADSAELEKAMKLRRAGQEHVSKAREADDSGPHWEQAIASFKKARGVLERANTDDPAVIAELTNVNSLLFWAGRMKPLEPGQKKAEPAREVAADDDDAAERMFGAAEAFEQDNPGDDLLVMARYFEVAKTFIKTEWSVKAMERLIELEEGRVQRRRKVAKQRVPDFGAAKPVPAAAEKDEELPKREWFMREVFDVERADGDLLVLRDGSSLNARVQDDELRIRTSFGLVKLRVSQVAGFKALEFQDTTDSDVFLVTINQDFIRGALKTAKLSVRLKDGSVRKLDTKDIVKYVRRADEGELSDVPLEQCVVLKDGHYLMGRILTEGVEINTDLGWIDVPRKDLNWLWIHGNAKQQVEIKRLGGDSLKGTLRVRGFTLNMSLGPKIRLKAEDVLGIFGEDKYYGGWTIGNHVIVLGRSSLVGYNDKKVSGGMKLTKITPGSPADKGGLRRGDVITHIEGKLAKSGHLAWYRDEVLAGRLGSALIKVKRSGNVIYFRMIK